MLKHPIFAQLQELKLTGMHHALQKQLQMAAIDQLSFAERFGRLVDRKMTERANRRLHYRLQKAKLQQAACIEDIDYQHPRGLDKVLFQQLLSCRWLDEHLNVSITGPTGVGKTWLACSLVHHAYRQGYTARYLRLPRLLQELQIARAAGRYSKLLCEYAKMHLLIIDDRGLAPLTSEGRRALLEILDDRHDRQSTLLTSQLPVASFEEYIDDPTIADALLDRLGHTAYTLNLTEESLRKCKKPLTLTAELSRLSRRRQLLRVGSYEDINELFIGNKGTGSVNGARAPGRA